MKPQDQSCFSRSGDEPRRPQVVATPARNEGLCRALRQSFEDACQIPDDMARLLSRLR